MSQFLTPGILVVFGIILVATFVQGMAGFGLGITAMPLLIAAVGLATAAPLMAVVGVLISLIMLIAYRESFSIRTVTKLLVGAVPGIPIGVFIIARSNEVLVTSVLGIVVASYALYMLVAPSAPKLHNQAWSYLVGLTAGTLSGAYSIGAPPVIVYGQLRRWPPDEFKSNLQGFYQVAGLMVVATHALGGNLTTTVWRYLIVSFPAVVIGGGLGIYLSSFINPEVFRKAVLILLMIMGIRLMLP